MVAVCCAILFFVNNSLEKGRIINGIKIADMFDFALTNAPERLDIGFIHKEVAEVGMYEKSLSSGTCLRLTDWDNGRYKLELTPANSYFSLIRFCHPNGVVSAKGYQFINDGFDKGTWYYYDETGVLVEEVGEEHLFGFTFDDVLDFCRKEGIVVQKGYVHPRSNDAYKYTHIIRYVFGETTLRGEWIIEFFNDKINRRESITLDGMTGKVLERETIEPLPI
jgi:hypothetical protein